MQTLVQCGNAPSEGWLRGNRVSSPRAAHQSPPPSHDPSTSRAFADDDRSVDDAPAQLNLHGVEHLRLVAPERNKNQKRKAQHHRRTTKGER
jgi:hypothetical protein